MGRYILRLGFVLVFISLNLAGCSGKDHSHGKLPADPLDAIQEINEIVVDIKSLHVTGDLTVEMEVEGQKQTVWMTTRGEIEIKDTQDFNMRIEATALFGSQEMKVEMIALDGQYWTRMGEQDWLKVPGDFTPLTSGIGGLPLVGIQYLEQAKDVRWMEDEKVAGLDCHHFGFNIDLDALISQDMLNQLASTDQHTEELISKIAESATIESEVWVDNEHLFPRRQTITAHVEVDSLPALDGKGFKYDAQIDWQYSKINEPVKIEAPSN